MSSSSLLLDHQQDKDSMLFWSDCVFKPNKEKNISVVIFLRILEVSRDLNGHYFLAPSDSKGAQQSVINKLRPM